MKVLTLALSALLLSHSAQAAMPRADLTIASEQSSVGEESEFNPFDPNAEQMLEQFDAVYEKETGLPAFPEIQSDLMWFAASGKGCFRESCKVYIDVDKATQTARLYLDGRLADQWAVSTGLPGHGTPNFDTHPNGRIFQKYSSKKYPGGDFNGLGNMPYAVFIKGGFALHGTPRGNWSKLGRRASHGCIRMHPENGKYFNHLVRSVGIRQTWIRVR